MGRSVPERHPANRRVAPEPGGRRRNAGADDEITDDLGGRNPRRAPNRSPGTEPVSPAPAAAEDAAAAETDTSEWIKRYARVRDLRVEWRDDD